MSSKGSKEDTKGIRKIQVDGHPWYVYFGICFDKKNNYKNIFDWKSDNKKRVSRWKRDLMLQFWTSPWACFFFYKKSKKGKNLTTLVGCGDHSGMVLDLLYKLANEHHMLLDLFPTRDRETMNVAANTLF